MYRTCLHCHATLGANEVIEHFPIGGRLAYDSAKGRLWVVCAKCRRWNLTPLEERWEAIEECERAFERTRLRASTDNIVLARVRGGLDLVRIGAPSFPEMSAWRYGQSLYRRWRRQVIPATVLLTGMYSAQALGNAGLVSFPLGFGAIALFSAWPIFTTWRRRRVRIMLPDGRVITVRTLARDSVELEPDGRDSWALRVTGKGGAARATGTAAVHAMRGALTAVNFSGGPREDIALAVSLLERLGDSRGLLNRVAGVAGKHGAANVSLLPPEVRLALEMALHEDSERTAMEGELQTLRDEWRLAEEVAKISDDMFLDPNVLTTLGRLKAAEKGR